MRQKRTAGRSDPQPGAEKILGLIKGLVALLCAPKARSCLPSSAASFIRWIASVASGSGRDLGWAHGWPGWPLFGTDLIRVDRAVLDFGRGKSCEWLTSSS